VQQLPAADELEFAAAVEDIDRRLRAEIRERQRHREQIAQLAAGDSLALPPEAVAYLDRLRQLDLPKRAIELERDAGILVAAQLPEQMPTLMMLKRAQLDTPAVTAIYLDLVEAADWEARGYRRSPTDSCRSRGPVQRLGGLRLRSRLRVRRGPGRTARLDLPQLAFHVLDEERHPMTHFRVAYQVCVPAGSRTSGETASDSRCGAVRHRFRSWR
jgi:hypothetical protein